ncbi:MAG: ABC transporter substrate-binding protein [Proteobacteria bacterium]|nr:ABC transporter substrate-binding protein [Pseudomonadota bacterium]
MRPTRGLYGSVACAEGPIPVWQVRRLLIIAIAMCAVSLPSRAAVVVSSKLDSEATLLSQMIRLLLNAHGVPTIDRTRIGATPVVRKALLTGEVDLYVEYTGNAGFFFNDVADAAWKDLEAGYALGARRDLEANHIVWLTPAHANNTWALAVRGDVASAHALRTMSDFGRWVAGGGAVMLACSAEFANAGTLRSLERTYGFTLTPEQKIVLAGGETAATIRAAAAGTNGVNTAMVYSTDGGIVAAHLVVLADDRHDQPVYAPVPLIREPVLAKYPQIATIVKPLMDSLTTPVLQQLNARIQIDGESDQEVAEDYLRSQHLL